MVRMVLNEVHPAIGAARPELVSRLAAMVAVANVVVLSGAGLSTESGIPDYRGPDGTLRRQLPMTLQTFTGDAAARRRYWARSQLGWRHVAQAQPNAGHRAVVELEHRGLLAGTITQNVDGLHAAAGSRGVVELHGSLAGVVCLGCGDRTSRELLDVRLRQANPGWQPSPSAVNPDGDIELGEQQLETFRPMECTTCGGVLKPDVVFFGETVPPERVAAGFELVERASALLVLGSSLLVMSGYRFVLRAVRRGVPVAIVNQGATRGDRTAALKVNAPLGAVLPELVQAVDGLAGAVAFASQRSSGRTPS